MGKVFKNKAERTEIMDEAKAKVVAQIAEQGFWKIAEDGRNGRVAITPNGLDRTLAKTFGKDDRQMLPFKSIQFIEHDRKSLGFDVVTLHTSAKAVSWKVVGDAEGFVDQVNARLV
tara:strand:+ start:132 stop:479 length:348 start_codon:yes stop_codon:yes gene_type:complete